MRFEDRGSTRGIGTAGRRNTGGSGIGKVHIIRHKIGTYFYPADSGYQPKEVDSIAPVCGVTVGQFAARMIYELNGDAEHDARQLARVTCKKCRSFLDG